MNTYKLTLPIGKLFDFLNINNDFYESVQQVDTKFNIKILTPKNTYESILGFVKKQGFVRTYVFDNVLIKCDERHLIKQSNGKFAQIRFTDHCMTDFGVKNKISQSDKCWKDVYDIALEYPHEYKTHSGIICHNTSLAKLIGKSLDADVLYINTSDENSVDVIRDKIKGFASTIGFSQWKIVILDEADFATANFQAALRNVLETYSKNTRFILTCNYIERIIDPIQSRLVSFNIQPPDKKSVALRAKYILENEGIAFELKDIAATVAQYYPDQRRIINSLQRNSVTGELKIDVQSQLIAGYCEKILEELKKSSDVKQTFQNIRQIIADSKVRQFDDLFKHLFDNLEGFAGEGKRAQMILHIADAQYKSNFVIDREIQIAAMFINILRDLKG